MTDNPKSTFARRVRAAKPRAKKYDVWDDVISGLGLRVGTSGHRAFFLRRSVRGRICSVTIGSADSMTVSEARAEARKLLATFIQPVREDNGPKTPGHPMPAFAEEFLERYARHWKPRTLESSTYMVGNHILPAFGHLTVDAITVEHVRDWFASMAERPGSANRAMPALSVMMRVYDLNPLRHKDFDFVFGVGSGIETVVVKKLRLSSRVWHGDRITLEADASKNPDVRFTR